MSSRVACALAIVAVLGCGGSKKSTPPTVSTGSDDGGAAMQMCIDMDGDGFGRFCAAGPDCNDNDPTITDECVRCAMPAQGCPCDPGTKPMRCDPHYMMKTTQNGKTGTVVCSEGTRYCRDGAYSACEVLFQYATFIPD